MTDAFDEFLAKYSREAREISLCLRALVLDIFPSAVEQIDPKSGTAVYGYNKPYKGLVLAIQPHKKHVNLMFSKGTQIPDPEGRLIGTGIHARHVRFTSEEQTQSPSLRRLIENALELNYSI